MGFTERKVFVEVSFVNNSATEGGAVFWSGFNIQIGDVIPFRPVMIKDSNFTGNFAV